MRRKKKPVCLLTTIAVLSSLALCAAPAQIQWERVSSLHYDLLLGRDLGSETTRLEIRDRVTGEVLFSENRGSVLASPVEWTLNEVRAALHEIACKDSVSLLFVIPAEQSYSEGFYIATITRNGLHSDSNKAKKAKLHEYGLLYNIGVTQGGDMAFCSGWERDRQCCLDAFIIDLNEGTVKKEIPCFMSCPKVEVAFRDSEGEGQEDYLAFQARLKKQLKALLDDAHAKGT